MIVGALLLYSNLNAQQSNVYADQKSIAGRVARELGAYVGDLRQQLDAYSLRVRSNVTPEQLIEAAQNAQARNFPDLIALSVIGSDGVEQVRVARLQAVIASQLTNYADDPHVAGALRFGKITYSSITTNQDGKPTFVLTQPVRNDAGAITGVLRAEISADPIIAALRTVTADSDNFSYAYLVNEADQTILSAESQSSTQALPAQLGQMLQGTSDVGEYVGARNQDVIGAFVPVNLEERNEQTGWVVVVEQPSAFAFATVRRSALLLTMLLLVVGMLALIWALRQARRFLIPIDALRQGAAAIGAGHLDHRITDISNDELGDVARAFNHMASDLQLSHNEIEQQNERLRHGLALARDIQIGLLPDRPPWNGDTMAVYARSIPAYEVGGDFYTYLALSEGRAAIAIGDISGKGVGAALIMALTASAVESQGRQLEHPAHVLTALNQLLAPRLKANHMNAALLFAVFDPYTKTLRVANAGMIAPVLISHTGNRMLDVGGLPLGTFIGAQYMEHEVHLDQGDTLLLLSDGVVEAHNTTRELFGFERLEETIAEAVPGDVRALVELVLVRVHEHMGEAEQHDDITIVAVRPLINAVKIPSDEEHAISYAII